LVQHRKHRAHPALTGLELAPLGRPGETSGNVGTKSLRIIGERNVGSMPSRQHGEMLRVRQEVAKEVGAAYMPPPQRGTPMTYTLDGKR